MSSRVLVRRRRVDGRLLWCVSWESLDRRRSSFWYFEHEGEARVVHQRLLAWDRGHGASLPVPARVDLAAD